MTDDDFYRRMRDTALSLACRELAEGDAVDRPEYFVPDVQGWWDLLTETAATMLRLQESEAGREAGAGPAEGVGENGV